MRKKTRRGGVRSPLAGISAGYLLLRRRILRSGLDTGLDAESVALSLRNCHPEYRRLKFQPFFHQVSQVLASIRNSSTTSVTSYDNASSSSGNSASPTATTSKRPRSDDYDSLTTTHKRTRYGSSLDESDESWSISTSEETYSDPKPAFDVVKSVLRDTYQKISTTTQHKTTGDHLQLFESSAKPKPTKNRQEDNVDIHMAFEKTKMVVSKNGPMNEERANERHNNSGGHEEEMGPAFADFGGMEEVIDVLRRKVIKPLWHPEVPRHLGANPMTGLLLHGPPGCGKTTLTHAIANEAGVPFYSISASNVTSFSDNLTSLFTKAYRTAPSIIFIDEIDVIASKRENLQRETDRRIVTQLMTCMNMLCLGLQGQASDPLQDKPPGYVVVIAATNRPDAIDPALRRPGRFGREIALGVPDEAARAEILSKLIKRLNLECKLDILKIAKSTSGYVGADLKALVDEAADLATDRELSKRPSSVNKENRRQPYGKADFESVTVTMEDFEDAAKIVQPSLRREGFSSIPNVTWDDVGGLNSIRKVFERSIINRTKYRGFEALAKKTTMEAGFLLFGPPGCGKTLIAKVVAKETGANFIHIKGPELLNKYVGESEAHIRKIFMHARINTPCIIFFDEIDAITTNRGNDGLRVVESMLTQLLTELDGGDKRNGVYVIGATNRIEAIDPAILRPGRLGEILYVPLPGPEDRLEIMKAQLNKLEVDYDVDLNSLARTDQCSILTGADLVSLMNKAADLAFEDRPDLANETNISHAFTIKTSHFEYALSQVTPSVSAQQREYYEALSEKYQATRL